MTGSFAQAAKATLQAAEASLARAVADVEDVAPPAPAPTVEDRLDRAAAEDQPASPAAGADEEEDEPTMASAVRDRRGADQQWVRECRLAVERAGEERARGSVMASDAFFPFRDGLEVRTAAGVRAVVQPGGSVRDEEGVYAATAAGSRLPMVIFHSFVAAAAFAVRRSFTP